MAKVRVVLNPKGIRALLGDPGVAKEMERRMAPVAAAAGLPVKVKKTGGYRAVARVEDDSAGALESEAKTGRLARALSFADARTGKP